MGQIIRGRILKYFIFLLAAFFFVPGFILCPISAKEKSDNKKPAAEAVAKSQDKSGENTGGEQGALQENQYEYEKPTVEEESYVWLIFKTLIVLGALIAGFYFFYKFVTKRTGIQILGRDVIKVLSVLPVGQNKFLQVIDLAGKIMVIGVSDSNINLITEIVDKNEIDRIRLLSSKSSPVHAGGFQDYIGKYVAKFFKKDGTVNREPEYEMRHYDDEIPASDNMDYLKKQRDRLKKINGNDDKK